MPTTGSTGTEQSNLPPSATIMIREQRPYPPGEVEVTPDAGRVYFENEDKEEYRVRFWRPKTDPNGGIDILLPAGQRITIVIKRNDEFSYSVLNIDNAVVKAMYGPIKN